MSESSEQHPLDQDWDENKPAPRRVWKTNAYLPMLKWCVRIALICVAAILVASVLLAIAPPSSTLEIVSGTLHSISRALLLAACIGIFLSYQIPKWNTFVAPSPTLAAKPLAQLVICNGFALTVFALPLIFYYVNDRISVYIIACLIFPVPGLLAVMAIWHKGCVRAYAIGALTTIFFLIASTSSFFLMIILRGRPPSMDMQVFTLLAAIVLPMISGLFCAFYVTLLERLREPEKANAPAISNSADSSNSSIG